MTDAKKMRAEWERACEDAKRNAVDLNGDFVAAWTVDAAKDLMAVARMMSGDCCTRCGGRGERTYGSSATWSGGAGGQVLTVDVCDVCWGTGQESVKGPNLRRLRSEAAR